MNRIILIILLILSVVSITAVSAESLIPQVDSVTVDVVNVTDGEPFINKCTNLSGGDAIICFNEYRTDVQFPQGVCIVHWYVGNGTQDIYPHNTQLVMADMFYKSADGKIISKMQNAFDDGAIGTFPLIDGYEAYQAKIWYIEV